LPIIIHAPEDSSPYSFLKKYNAALFCGDSSEESLIEVMKKINNKDLVSKVVANANRAFEENLTPAVIKQELAEFLSLK
jgi:hypothetical protein